MPPPSEVKYGILVIPPMTNMLISPSMFDGQKSVRAKFFVGVILVPYFRTPSVFTHFPVLYHPPPPQLRLFRPPAPVHEVVFTMATVGQKIARAKIFVRKIIVSRVGGGACCCPARGGARARARAARLQISWQARLWVRLNGLLCSSRM